MLYKAKRILGCKLKGLDGEIGLVKEFLFDDRHWAIRYLVAETGSWLIGKRVLISPYALHAVNEEENHVAVDLTKLQIENSPSLETDKPVSRQFEEAYYGYYAWPRYWRGPHIWGNAEKIMHSGQHEPNTANAGGKSFDAHLRSTNDVSGHHIQAIDGDIGHVEDFIIEDTTWAIRYLVINTRNWWPGKVVIVAPQWIESVSWEKSKVLINLTREDIKKSPEYSEEALITRDYETGLYRHYGKPGYWSNETTVIKKPKKSTKPVTLID